MRFCLASLEGFLLRLKFRILEFLHYVLANSPRDMQNTPLLIPNVAALVRNLYKRSTLSHPTLGKVSIPTGTKKEKSPYTLWKNASGTPTMQKLLFERNVCCSTSLSAPLIQAPLSRYRGRVHNTPAGERGHVVCAT